LKPHGCRGNISVSRRELIGAGLLAVLSSSSAAEKTLAFDNGEGETLYNGIRLPAEWPPRATEPTFEPMPIPYLAAPPAVIPIDIGRQLFVDDFLIERTTLRRTFHHAEYHPACPVLRPDRPWEKEGGNPTAMVFSDGVWYDPEERVFKMWYMAGYTVSTCYATSRDGITWEKPSLDLRPGTNIVEPSKRDSAIVWLDLEERDPKRRYKLFVVADRIASSWRMRVHFSPDGIHWGQPVAVSGPCGDRSTVFWNPFRRIWVYSLRSDSRYGRDRLYREHPDVLRGAAWKAGEPGWWLGADRLDAPRADMKIQPQLYNLDAVAYESLMLGLFSIWHGQTVDRPKPNTVKIGFSRDGYHWHRPDRTAFLPVSERREDWNWGNVQSAGGGCLIVGDRLYFYVSGRTSSPDAPARHTCTTGLATLRRDGFASMDADTTGTLTTRPLRFKGRHLFVNGDMSRGELRVECLDEHGNALHSYTSSDCQPIRSDRTQLHVRWKKGQDLSSLAGRAVRFRFHLARGSLFSFWVSPDTSGASHGYVAAGGPGFLGPTDTVLR
jgi:hypothetical protein